MDQQNKTCIEFDYTSFLGATASKKWTFLDVCHHRPHLWSDVEKEPCRAQ